MHHANSSGVSQLHKVHAKLECSKLLARAAFMQNKDHRHDALRHDAAFKGLTVV